MYTDLMLVLNIHFLMESLKLLDLVKTLRNLDKNLLKVKPLRETSNKGINRIARFERNPYVN